MTKWLEENLLKLESRDYFKHLTGIRRGFEKECLRVNAEGHLSQHPHPKVLGSSLTHPFITTDYSEALLEFITPPTNSIEELFNKLTEIHTFVYQHLQDELLWAGSMPCVLPPENEIPIAEYGTSNIGLLKNIYRRGLGIRYGRKMQTIAGIHFNFSFSQTFFEAYHELMESKHSLKTFISEQYLGLMRNCLRFGWILPLLLGASPSLCRTFLNKDIPNFLEPWQGDTLINRTATSLRLSDLGYHNTTQSQLRISYNSLPELISSLHQAVHTPVPEYTQIGVRENGNGQYKQLSDCILQIEDEHYALVRPKRVTKPDERLLQAFMDRGIEYIEVRALDINPFLPLGIDENSVRFLDTFLTTCLLLESPLIEESEWLLIQKNHERTAKFGLDPTLKLLVGKEEEKPIKKLAFEFLSLMRSVSMLLDKAYGSDHYLTTLNEVIQDLEYSEKLPSARVLNEMMSKKETHCGFMSRYSRLHQSAFLNQALSPLVLENYQQLAVNSFQEQAVLEENNIPFEEFLNQYLKI